MIRTVLRSKQFVIQVPSFVTPAAHRRLLHSSCFRFASTLEKVKEKERTVVPKPKRAKMKMDPYVKNLFFGKVDPHIFAYNELDLGNLNVIVDMREHIQKVIAGESSLQTSSEKITKETIEKLKELGIFKLNIPKEYGGLESSCTEMIFLTELFSKNPSLFHTINVHLHYVSNLLCMFANDEQKEKYLPALASGDLQIGFAAWEENAGLDLSKIETNMSFHGDKYVLNGSKKWVCNGGIADKFIVFASEEGRIQDSVSCFLVDKHADGVSAKSMDTLGLHGYNAWEVTFKNTPVPRENLIGQAGHGLSMLTSVLNGKFTLAGAHIGLLRDLIDQTVKYTINNESFGKPLIEHDVVKHNLAEAAARLYALESVTYMTADLYDNIEDPDIEVETAIVKVYSCEASMFIIQKCLSIMGSDCYVKGNPYESLLRDALFVPMVDTSVDALRLTIALLCLQHIGQSFQKVVLQRRNPFFYPKVALSSLFTKWFKVHDDVYTFQGVIYEHVHPSLELSAAFIEKSVIRTGRTMEELLVIWGKQINTSQVNLIRIADIAIDLYVATSVLARTSRSISIGLRNCEVDGNLNNVISSEIFSSIRTNLESLLDSPYGNNDANCKTIAERMLHERKYHAAHPLARNF